MANNTLIVGASGGIGQALVKQYAQNSDHVYAVTRATKPDSDMPNNVSLHCMKSQNDAAISEFLKDLKSEGIALSTVVITTGFLHNDDAGIHPEKRLEDISEDVCYTSSELISSIKKNLLNSVISKKQEMASQKLCVYDDGKASKRVVDFFFFDQKETCSIT